MWKGSCVICSKKKIYNFNKKNNECGVIGSSTRNVLFTKTIIVHYKLIKKINGKSFFFESNGGDGRDVEREAKGKIFVRLCATVFNCVLEIKFFIVQMRKRLFYK